jgi:hypothetical protein
MPTTENQQLQRLGASYDLYAAQSDPLTVAISKLLTAITGLEDSFTKDITLLVQSLMGNANPTVGVARTVHAGIMRHGAPMSYGGSTLGMVGGHDVATYHAGQAFMRDVMGSFQGPTGLPNYRAHGLNQQQMQQAAALAFRGGEQYRGGQMFNESGGEVRINPGAAERMKKYVEDSASTLSMIRDVMGSKALDDLEKTMSQVFGGSITEVGTRAARMRMMHLKAMTTGSFGGNVEAAAAFSRTNADFISMGMGGGQMGLAEARTAFGTSANVLAAMVDRRVLAGGRATVANSAIMSGITGGPNVSRSLEQIAQDTASQTGMIAGEERELQVLNFLEGTMQFNERESRQARNLRQELINAGSDPVKIEAARNRMEEFIGRKGMKTTGQFYDQYGAEEIARRGIKTTTAGEIQARRTVDMAVDDLLRDERFGTAAYGRMSDAGVDVFGRGVLALGATEVAALDAALGLEGPAREKAIAELMNNGDVSRAFRQAGIKSGDFSAVAQGATRQALATTLLTGEMNNVTPFMEEQREKEKALRLAIKDHTYGYRNQGDAVTEFMKGLFNVADPTAQQIIDKEMEREMNDVQRLDSDIHGNLRSTRDNFGKLQKILGNDFGVRSFEEFHNRLRNDPTFQMEMMDKLKEKGAFSIGTGEGGESVWNFLDSEKAEKIRNKMQEDLRKEELQLLGVDVSDNRWKTYLKPDGTVDMNRVMRDEQRRGLTQTNLENEFLNMFPGGDITVDPDTGEALGEDGKVKKSALLRIAESGALSHDVRNSYLEKVGEMMEAANKEYDTAKGALDETGMTEAGAKLIELSKIESALQDPSKYPTTTNMYVENLIVTSDSRENDRAR